MLICYVCACPGVLKKALGSPEPTVRSGGLNLGPLEKHLYP